MRRGYGCVNMLKRLFKKFHWAFFGIKEVVLKEQSFRIQIIAAVLIVFFAISLKISILEFIILFIVITIVLILEMINSVIERIMDIINHEFHPQIRAIKDISAASVLLASISATIIGLLIFFPYVF